MQTYNLPVPIVCLDEACGVVYIHPNLISAVDGAQITFSDVRVSPCPGCGGTGKILDGTYRFKDQLLSMIEGPAESAETYQQILNILRFHKTVGSSPAEVVRTVEKISPQTAKTFTSIINSSASKDWLTILMAFLTLVMQFHSTYLVNKEEESEYVTFLKKELSTSREETKKLQKEKDLLFQDLTKAKLMQEFNIVSPKQKCPCGSKKKFKKCHGRDL